MNKLIIATSIVILVFLYTSCTGYYMNVESLQKEFALIDSSKLIEVKTIGIYGETYTYLANPFDSINCSNKHNEIVKMANSPSTELKVLEFNKNKTTLYLDRVFVKDSFLFGFDSRISENLKVIPLKSIKKIQLYNGKQMFTYIN